MKFATALISGRQISVMDLWGGIWVEIAKALPAGLAPQNSGLIDYIGLGDRFIEACEQVGKAGRPDPAWVVEAPRFCAPIPRPPKNVFCVGRNYWDHIAEDNRSRDLQTDLPKYPQFFTKPPTAIIGPDDIIELHPEVTRRLDYEVELAVVIGKAGRNIAQHDAMEHVFGYTICNDVTARDLQRRHDQWFKGKGLDSSCPIGPCIVHKSAIPDIADLGIRLSVNGELRQNAKIADLLFPIPELIESLSAGITLEPGDIIATGTPSGVGYAMDPRQYLAEGDVVRCEIDGIGLLENTVSANRILKGIEHD